MTSSSDYGFSRKGAAGTDVRSTFSYPMYRQFVVDNRTMEDLFADESFRDRGFWRKGFVEVARLVDAVVADR